MGGAVRPAESGTIGARKEAYMHVIPFVDEGLGNSSYLVEVGEGLALAVDPGRDPAPYRAEAERRGLQIGWTAETHLHADFVSGSRELAAGGTTVLAPADGGIEFGHRGLRHGDELPVGDLILRALATPGHTPEHLAYLLLDGELPLAVFTGGSLLVGSVARTDLIAPEETDRLARALYRSVREHLLALPDEVTVYPTHGAGSFCSTPAGGERVTTIGRERATNPLLAAPDEDSFVLALLGSLGTYPRYFQRLRAVNRQGPRVYGEKWPSLEPLSIDAVRRFRDDGAELIDVRPIDRYAESHIPGALSIELRPAFASWLGWLVEADTPLAFVLDPGQDRAELVRQCLTIGYERIAGELDGGMDAWMTAGAPTKRISLVGPGALASYRILDVRQESEFSAGHVPGALHVELGSLTQAVDGLDTVPTVVMCGHGERAMTGASVLESAGRSDLAVLRGGPRDWSRATGATLERAR